MATIILLRRYSLLGMNMFNMSFLCNITGTKLIWQNVFRGGDQIVIFKKKHDFEIRQFETKSNISLNRVSKK